MKIVLHKIILFSTLQLLLLGIILFTWSGDSAFAEEKPEECPFSAFLEGPKDANACGMACGQSNYNKSMFRSRGFSNDATGKKKCCCKESRGAGSAAGKGTFGPNVANPFGEVYNVPMLIGKTLRLFMGILGVIALVIFIYGGFLWMISLGDETRVKKGRETMIWAGMGLIAIVGSYVVIQFILEAVL